MIKHSASHLDHNITAAQLDYLLHRFADRTAFFIETVELPPELGTVPCALYGPTMGDAPVDEDRVFYKARGERAYASRLLDAPTRPTNKITVIAGPHDGHDCIIYTAFGGPLAPKEPDDPTLNESDKPDSRSFWSTHSLAIAP